MALTTTETLTLREFGVAIDNYNTIIEESEEVGTLDALLFGQGRYGGKSDEEGHRRDARPLREPGQGL